MQFAGMDSEEARRFADKWLEAWTGNRPAGLISFYADDAFYSDPAIPAGVRGRSSLLVYFTKLLALNPAWVWRHSGSIPIRDGFLNQWTATIPVGVRTIEATGVCTVQLCEDLIYSNQVFFDRSELLDAIRRARADA
jgi:hypothetical protein